MLLGDPASLISILEHFYFAPSSILTNIQHTVKKPISFDDLLGYRLPRVGLQSIDRGEEERTVGGTVSPQKHGYEEAKKQGYR